MNTKLSAPGLTVALFMMLLIGGLCGRASAVVSTPIAACGTLSSPGNYFLTGNISASGDCIVIAADNVAIDMKGKTITGNGSGAGITDHGASFHFQIISNGKIRNFANGIDLSSSGEAIINNVDSSKNTNDGIFIEECCNTLNAVTANNNGGTGIDIDSDDSSLSNIQANGNGDGGIFILRCCNTLVGSTVSKNTGIGVEMDECCSFVVASKIQKNTGDGIELASDDNGVIKSVSSGNGGDGMDFPTKGENMVTASKSNGNADIGIFMNDRFGIFSGVQVNKNGGGGVSMPCRGSTASLTATKNKSFNLSQSPTTDGPCANVNLKAP